MPDPDPHEPQVSLESKVAFLRQAGSFPPPAFRVEAIETHMAWVFLTERHAYKLKKPVRYEYLDFSTVEARRFYCEEEVRLNRRLAGDVYLGVVPLVLNARGHLELGQVGQCVDWLVKMRRLPSVHMLDFALRLGVASDGDIRCVAQRLAGFYKGCTPVPLAPEEYRGRFLRHIDANLREFSQAPHPQAFPQAETVAGDLGVAVYTLAPTLDARVHAGRIVDGHGDLRPEHICLRPQVEIIDCLEFSPLLRTVDPLDEVGFLALELDRLGAAPLAATLLRYYGAMIDADIPAPVLHFYQAYRAMVRATIALRHLNEEKFRLSPEWTSRTRAYLELAERHLAEC